MKEMNGMKEMKEIISFISHFGEALITRGRDRDSS